MSNFPVRTAAKAIILHNNKILVMQKNNDGNTPHVYMGDIN